MRVVRGFFALTIVAAAGGLWAMASAAGADEGKAIDCADTGMSFTALDFDVKCEDHSDSSVSVGELAIGVRIHTLHAVSQKDITFLDVIDDRIMGSTRVFYNKTSMENDI